MSEGIVSSSRTFSGSGEKEFTIVTEGGAIRASSPSEVEIYERAVVESGKIISSKHDEGAKEYYKKEIEAIITRLGLRGRIAALDKKLEERKVGAMSKMLADLCRAAEKVSRAFISGAPMVVRYHNDGDGAASGMAVYKALSKIVDLGLCEDRQVSWQMNRSVFYTLDSLYFDKMVFESHKSAERPMLVICNFGTGAESNGAIAAASEICDIVWIDHHVIPENFNPGKNTLYVNPFNNGENSALTAGFICSVFSELFGADPGQLGEAALISDYSTYADLTNSEAQKVAMVLDYLTSERNAGERKPKQMVEIIGDKAELERLYSIAFTSMDEAVKSGIKTMRRYKSANGANVCVVRFSDLGPISVYPLPGRYSSRLHYVLETANGGNTITIVYYGSYISVRVSQDIKEKVDLLGIISKMSAETHGTVSGGGHREAASVKSNYNDIEQTLSMLLGMLGTPV